MNLIGLMLKVFIEIILIGRLTNVAKLKVKFKKTSTAKFLWAAQAKNKITSWKLKKVHVS